MNPDGHLDELESRLRSAPLKTLPPGARQRLLAGIAATETPPMRVLLFRRVASIAAVITLAAAGVLAWRLTIPASPQRLAMVTTATSSIDIEVIAHRSTPLHELDVREWRVLRASHQSTER